ncbi:hypothetical protein KUTeg_023917 [Tegillarca granosa]|uniref:EGF-like domain-containing protein n=1 Tax=Tegillarca granosa TaxID=220873 RepID=A0ABQ9E111_TEGGR|nr:hypothetical protein KUTeg_023917 [Tegillarca granosa]
MFNDTKKVKLFIIFIFIKTTDVIIHPSNCFTPFQAASLSSSFTDIQQVSTTLLSSKSVHLSSISAKQTTMIEPTRSSWSLQSLITQTSTQLTTNGASFLSTSETDLSTVGLSTLQTASPNIENTLSNIRTNLPTETNTISYTQTKSDTFIIHSSTLEFETFSTTLTGSLPTNSQTLNSHNTEKTVELSSSFSERFVESSEFATSKMTTFLLQTSTQKTSKSSEVVIQPSRDNFSSQQGTHKLPTPGITSYPSVLPSGSFSQKLSLTSMEGSQITSPLPFTVSVSSPSHYSNNVFMSMSKTTPLNPSSSIVPFPNGTTSVTHTSSVSTISLPSTSLKTTPQTSKWTTISLVSSTFTSTTPRMVTIQRSCQSVSQCPENAECEADQCGEYRCRCRLGYTENSKSTKCLKLVPLGGECDQTTVCIGRNTRCYRYKCSCNQNYETTSNHKWCRRQKSWFISFPLLGDECSNFFADCYNNNEQICASGACRCKTGLREKELDDTKADTRSLSQCINETIISGMYVISSS